ncbi:MAG: response regulator [Methanococcaceae archaeon]
MPIKVSIVEDIDEIREQLALIIDSTAGFECGSIFEDSESAIAGLKYEDTDVVLMDINLPKMDGIECVQKLKAMKPQMQFIMLTVYDDVEKIFESLKAGASGYLLKRTPPEKLLEAIEDVFNGGSPMSGPIARMVVESFQKPAFSLPHHNLTKRELEILELLSKGYKYKEIGESLFISVETVRSHLRKVYEKLHVRSGTEAVLKYLNK